MHDVFVSRQPLVNRQSKVIATRLTLHYGEEANATDAVGMLTDLANAWPTGSKPVFVTCGATGCDAELLDWPAPEHIAIELPAALLVGPHGADVINTLQTFQPTVCLHFDPQAAQALASGVRLRFIGFDSATLQANQLKVLAARTRACGIAIAFNVDSHACFQTCLDAGMTAAAGWFFTAPTQAKSKSLSPGQANIVRVLNLVRSNAEIREIEAALKVDVAISYKLLRYINAAGFGLSCEIQSFRHAVTMLGYQKLNRWLSLLLGTASKDPMAPALMHTALLRGRLMELLASGLVDPSEYDNLFITGAFSLLDVLLGIDMERALEAMRLPEPICEALLGHGGRYQPFLDLARSSESNDGQAIAEQTAMLGLTAHQLNRSQLQALSFADAMEL